MVAAFGIHVNILFPLRVRPEPYASKRNKV